MTDEKYTFVQDVREKKVTGYSARKRRTHGGKRGRVKFPSDHLTKKELLRMSGECKSYRLNEPMKWAQFKEMPDDLKITYIKLIREKYNADGKSIAEMLGVCSATATKEFRRLGIGEGKTRGHYTKWDKEGFLAWCHGVSLPAEEIPVAEPAEVKSLGEQVQELEEELLNLQEEPVSEEVQEIEPEIVKEEPAKVVPKAGNMIFEGTAQDVLKTVAVLLGGANVRINLTWTLVED